MMNGPVRRFNCGDLQRVLVSIELRQTVLDAKISLYVEELAALKKQIALLCAVGTPPPSDQESLEDRLKRIEKSFSLLIRT
ncbi:MAG: hypothetical protein ACR2PG_04815 [Hyphomicrobiaceae bacterium]